MQSIAYYYSQFLAFILPPYKYKEYFCISNANRRIESGLSMGQRPKSSNKQHALNQRSPAEGKGKGQKLLAQGSALGIMAISKAPCKGNSFILPGVLKLLPLQGDRLPPQTTQGVALGIKALSKAPC